MVKIIKDILNNKVNNRNTINIKNYKSNIDKANDNEKNCFC